MLDFGTTDDYMYLALEYFPCGSLRERLKHPVSEADAVNYAHQIGEALQIVHAARVVHRDLKPSNLMLTNENRLVLIDFGSARTQFVPSDLSPFRRLHRDPLLRVPGADRRPRTGRARRSVQPRRGAVRDAGRLLAVFRQEPGGHPGGAPLGAACRVCRNSSHHTSPSSIGCWRRIQKDRYASAAEFLDALDGVRAELIHPETQQITAECLIHEALVLPQFRSLAFLLAVWWCWSSILAFSFVAVVLIPGLELASELADSSVTLKFAGQQQRNPAVIRASLDSMHDRLTNRGYIQESLDQLRDAVAKLDAGLRDMNAPRPASWFALLGRHRRHGSIHCRKARGGAA